MLPIPLLCFEQSSFAQVLKGSAHGRLRQLELTGNGRDCRPAFAVFVSSVCKIGFHLRINIGGADTIRSLTVSAVVDAAIGSTLRLYGFALIQRSLKVEQHIVGSLPN